MKIINFVVYFFIIIFFSGCATIAKEGSCVKDDWLEGYNCKNYVLEIISDPEGAKIEINNDYIGDAPIKYTLDENYLPYDGLYVVAYPIYEGQHVQTKYLEMNTLPKRIYFGMDLAPSPDKVEIDWN